MLLPVQMEQTPSNFSCDNNKNAAFKAITKTALDRYVDDSGPPSCHRTSTVRITLAACQVEARRGEGQRPLQRRTAHVRESDRSRPRPDILTSHAPAMHRELMKAETVPRAQHPQLGPSTPPKAMRAYGPRVPHRRRRSQNTLNDT